MGSGKLIPPYKENAPTDDNGCWVLMLCIVCTGNTYVISRKTDYFSGDDKDTSESYDDLSISKFHCQWPCSTQDQFEDTKRRADKALKAGFDAHYIPIATGTPFRF